MFWTNKIISQSSGPQLINDSKTPSGKSHVGALRGPIIHHALYLAMKEAGMEVDYWFGFDDYDPMDELPIKGDESYRDLLGVPLCNAPSPDPEKGTDVADYYTKDFLAVLDKIGVKPKTYRMRDVYREGKFNEQIDKILRSGDKVREVYLSVSGSERPENWLPFQVICEKCGKVGCSVVTDYDGKEVTYTCAENLVSWAKGCGYTGKVSPFDGNGKLPWKLEWAAKWENFGITVEGAGKDHSTKGGSRDVTSACLRAIFGKNPPTNMPYEFFLLGGAKMSSSKGIGVSAEEMSNLLSPEVLRYLLVRTKPNTQVNFAPQDDQMIKLYNDFDRMRVDAAQEEPKSPDSKIISKICEAEPVVEPESLVNYQLLSNIAQMPHLDPLSYLENNAGVEMTAATQADVEMKLSSARVWLTDHATEDEKFEIQQSVPSSLHEQFSNTQKAFISLLHHAVKEVGEISPDEMQSIVFKAARTTPANANNAFMALYQLFLAKERGPKAGHLLAFLERDFVLSHLSQFTYDEPLLKVESCEGLEQVEKFIKKSSGKWSSVEVEPLLLGAGASGAWSDLQSVDQFRAVEKGVGIAELTLTLLDGRAFIKRVQLTEFTSSTLEAEQATVAQAVADWAVRDLAGLSV